MHRHFRSECQLTCASSFRPATARRSATSQITVSRSTMAPSSTTESVTKRLRRTCLSWTRLCKMWSSWRRLIRLLMDMSPKPRTTRMRANSSLLKRLRRVASRYLLVHDDLRQPSSDRSSAVGNIFFGNLGGNHGISFWTVFLGFLTLSQVLSSGQCVILIFIHDDSLLSSL